MVLRLLLRPRWLALHVAAVVIASGFVALGWWQLGVYQESQARQEARDRSPVPLSTVAVAGNPLGDAIDRPVTAAGSYGEDLVVPARVHEDVLGAFAVATLDTGDGLLVVLRGWQHDPAGIEPAPAGEVLVSGHLVPAEVPEQATGPHPVPAGQVGYVSPDAVAEATGRGTAEFFDGYLVAMTEDPPPADPPERLDVSSVAPIRDVSPWQNLSYWAQWWVFAGAVLVFWASFVRAGLKKRGSPAGPDVQPEPEQPPSVRQRTTSSG
ncbi:MAG TPA: SURF1 family protein [Jiangellaceae bacterium]|nr:SURF1 family protein [Jiangellaceae bacterium]